MERFRIKSGYYTTTIAFIAGLLILNGFIQGASGEDKRAQKVISEVLAKLAPSQWKGSYRFTNYRTDGTKKTYTLDILALNSSTVHITFTSPATDAGRQILNKDGEIWSYLPDSRKVVRLADRDSIGNGDFNNADVMKLNWLEEYNVKLVKESDTQMVIDMTAKEGGSASYYMVRLWVMKAGNQPIQQYFYDTSGHHLKTLKYRNVLKFGGIERPSQMVMENVVTGQRTLLEVLSFASQKSLPESRFRQENLGK